MSLHFGHIEIISYFHMPWRLSNVLKKLGGEGHVRDNGVYLSDLLSCGIHTDDILGLYFSSSDVENKTKYCVALGFVNQALPIFEKKYPNNFQLRRHIDTIQRYIDGQVTEEALKAADFATHELLDFKASDSAEKNVVLAVWYLVRSIRIDLWSFIVMSAHHALKAITHGSSDDEYRFEARRQVQHIIKSTEVQS